MTSTVTTLPEIEAILEQDAPGLPDGVLLSHVEEFLQKKESFLQCAAEKTPPFYIFDKQGLISRATRFMKIFKEKIPRFQAFFAVKSNNYAAVSHAVVACGLGLDVSSGIELESAANTGCRHILFSGPGKTDAELMAVLNYSERVTVLIDSFNELDRLSQMAEAQRTPVRAGVRLTTQQKGLWRKFGIGLDVLPLFIDKAKKSGYVQLKGLHFHTSWNLNPEAQVSFLQKLGKTLESLSTAERSEIEFLDIGGGYWPEYGEWVHFNATPKGSLLQTIGADYSCRKHYRFAARPLTCFVKEFSKCLSENVFPYIDCMIYAEPGRWLVEPAMHLLLQVIDKKADDLVIVDAGTNIIGWERFETDYAPVINLNRPSLNEQPCMIFGSLCTPHDIWGYGYFGEAIEPGDHLLIPNQGAYTYSLRQQFIKPLAEVVTMKSLESD